MEAEDREDEEYYLAAALLLLWADFGEDSLLGTNGWQIFRTRFYERISPILFRIYGKARTKLADEFGYKYPSRTNDDGSTTTTVPGMRNRVEETAREIFERFRGRQQENKNRQQSGEEPNSFNESDANRDSATTITETQSRGEIDASNDVESRTGVRLVAVWRTEPGACPICAPLEGTTREWRARFPEGPPGHKNCRCHLEWRRFI